MSKRDHKNSRYKRKPAVKSQSYVDILAMIADLLDKLEKPELSLLASDQLHQLRSKVETLTIALRLTLIALVCHGQNSETAQVALEEVSKLYRLQTDYEEIKQEI